MYSKIARLLKQAKTPLSVTLVGGAAAYSFHAPAKLSENEQPTMGNFKAPLHKLPKGYQMLQERSQTLKKEAITAGTVCPLLAVTWFLFTSRAASSPVAMALLLTGGLIAGERSLQISKINQLVSYNVIVHPESVISSMAQDSELHQILAGNHPLITLNEEGITVTGPLGNIGTPSALFQETLEYIKNKDKFVLPSIVLNPWIQKSAELAHDRWLLRLALPLSLLSLIAVVLKDPKERNADDYAVGAGSAYNLFDYFNGPSLGTVRDLISTKLCEAENTEELMQLLVEHNILKGGMNFLEDWAREQDVIGVRVSRLGSVVLYDKSRMFPSIGGPYPTREFPQQCHESQTEENRLCVGSTTSI